MRDIRRKMAEKSLNAVSGKEKKLKKKRKKRQYNNRKVFRRCRQTLITYLNHWCYIKSLICWKMECFGKYEYCGKLRLVYYCNLKIWIYSSKQLFKGEGHTARRSHIKFREDNHVKKCFLSAKLWDCSVATIILCDIECFEMRFSIPKR